MTDATTEDGFLGGRLRIAQPATGYRAGVDPVFLAAAVPARVGERVLDLGTGVGTALLCLAARVPGLALHGLELQPAYADLARGNAATNGIAATIHQGDIRSMPTALRETAFDHVMMNPPWFRPAERTAASDPGRETALAEALDPADWCDAALRRLRPGGCLTAIHVPEALAPLLSALDGRASVRVHPVAPRAGRDATRILLTARKGGRAPLTLAPTTILHRGDRHDGDRGDYTDAAEAVLRHGNAWPWVDR